MSATARGSAARVDAQGKINLALRILAREASGHHTLETIFCRLALADAIVVRPRADGERRLEWRGTDVGPPESNLAMRAAAAYAAAAGWPRGLHVAVEKRIPVGAGLGGGSADAGAVLRALDALAPEPLGSHRLLDVARSLGADVPYLTTTAAVALAWGIGERMLELPALPERRVVLAIPRYAVSTREAFAWADAAGVPEREPRLIARDALTNWDGIAAVAGNDFDTILAGRHPELRATAERLRAGGAMIAQLSGSGSAVFGIFEGEPDLAALAGPGEFDLLATTTAGVSAPELID